MRRLVLGCGSLGTHIIEELSGRQGELHVITDESGRATALREEHVSAAEADPLDPTNYPDHADIVFVAGPSATDNLSAADHAHRHFPDAMLVAYAGEDATEADLRAMRELADRVIDPIGIQSDRILDVSTGVRADRLRRMARALRSVDGKLAVVAHDNPDPDAIAAAVALVRVAQFAGTDAQACYYGDISHQENRALVNLLDIGMRRLDPDDDPREEFDAFALVDHSRPGVNDSLPDDIEPIIVVDHHPPREPVDAGFIDLRDGVGSTSTLLVEYLDRFGLTPDSRLATALLYGIRIDTKEFTREVAEADFDAAAYLMPMVDTDVLARVESPSVDPAVFDVLARAIENRDQRGTALASGVGEIRNRDALAQAAEHLLNMEGVNTTVVYGYQDGVIYVSGRTRGADLDLGETLRDALSQIGSAGGHADMAGAQIPLGILADVEDGSKETLADIVDDIIAGRLFETLADAPSAPVRTAERELRFPDED
ncbi:DHH family phosphoesterase [Halobaculum limi]|uniref:DHH family phosphoesterase n=1 Tax=Halobaculum limi TaxID=3031916 RepID=UPI002406499C|nr:DHH family phosphoesterase [Halobaculum sp. YSMS11]